MLGLQYGAYPALEGMDSERCLRTAGLKMRSSPAVTSLGKQRQLWTARDDCTTSLQALKSSRINP